MADESTFAEFYGNTYRGVVAQLYAYTGNLAEAQESAQEAYVRAWSRWKSICDYDEPRAWVCRVAYRVAISRWRRARTAAEAHRRQGPPKPEPPPEESNADLVAALRRLPESQQRALVLHYLGGFSVAEIAATEGVAVGTIKSRLSRGREALAGMLDGYRIGPTSAVRAVVRAAAPGAATTAVPTVRAPAATALATAPATAGVQAGVNGSA